MIGKRNVLFISVIWITVAGIGQLSYNTTLLGRWSNDSLPVLGGMTDGQRFNELWGYYDSAKSKEYIVMGGLDSIYFFDVTDPSKIKLCDVEAGKAKGCINRDFQTYKHYAYAVNDQNHGSLQIFDMQYLPDSVHKVYDSDTLGKTTHTICIYKDKIYMCSNTENANIHHSMKIASLAQPDSPVFISTFDAPIIGGNKLFSNIHDMIIVDDTAYLSCGNDGLYIYDISNPLALKYVYSLNQYVEKGYNHNSWLTSDKKHIVFTDENPGLGVKLYEIENPTSYRFKNIFRSHVGAMAHNPFIVGNTKAYFSYYMDGVYMYDISDASNPVVLAYYDTYPENIGYPGNGFQGCWGVYPFLPSGTIFACDMTHGLFALRMNVTGINDPTRKEALGLFPNPVNDKTIMKLFSPSDGSAQLEITNAKGQIIENTLITLSFGKNEIPLSTMNLNQGIYFIQITSANASYSAKLVKQ